MIPKAISPQWPRRHCCNLICIPSIIVITPIPTRTSEDIIMATTNSLIIVTIFFVAATIIAQEMTTTASKYYTPIPSPCLCTEFRCDDGSACLDKSRVCNGYTDCPAGEDELIHSRDKTKKCVLKNTSKCNGTSEFRCKFGGCIRVEEVCDGTVHCFGGVDEAHDLCTYLFS